ncbi:helix-turn-helix domain-containing protein (plasmid) [Rhizobium leguminosarum]
MTELQVATRIVPVESVEALREAVSGADFDIVQLARGKLTGSLTHASIGTTSLSVGRFSCALRSRGVASPNRHTMAMLLDGTGMRSSLSDAVAPGDIAILPARQGHESFYHGPASYAAISFDPSEIADMFVEEEMAEAALTRSNRYRLPEPVRSAVRDDFLSIIAFVEQEGVGISPRTAEFLQRALKEVFVTGIRHCLPPTRQVQVRSATRLIGDIEDYLEAAGPRPVHISELCCQFRVSRRTLHRTFTGTLGNGPIAYLRQKRLSAVHAVLKRGDPEHLKVSDVAIEHGFFEHGRFSGYYRAQFGENPSDTLRSHPS